MDVTARVALPGAQGGGPGRGLVVFGPSTTASASMPRSSRPAPQAAVASPFPLQRLVVLVFVAIVGMATVLTSATLAAHTLAATTARSSFRVVLPQALTAAASSAVLESRPDRSDHEQLLSIFCSGPLLHDIQMNHVFADSKHFVDMPIKATSNPATILYEYDAYIKSQGPGWMLLEQKDRIVKLRQFLDKHFDEPGADLTPVVPLDYQETQLPPAIAAIESSAFREWAFQLHKLWKILGRVPNPDVQSSFLHARPVEHLQLQRTQNVLVVPGGRFRESYYWDSFWIVEGLLVSNMKQTARGVVNNLLEYVTEFGFVPNGGRIYYLTRSQPPMLSDMVRLVAMKNNDSVAAFSAEPGAGDASNYDLEYLQVVVPILEKEYAFWMQTGPSGHAVEVEAPANADSDAVKKGPYILNRYVVHADAPRPESYREDFQDADIAFADPKKFHDTPEIRAKKEVFYNEIIAAAESGWDFSSRWLKDEHTLRTIDTSNVIPVDLNVKLYRVEHNLAHFNALLGNDKAAAFFKDAAAKRAEAMNSILWSDLHQSWRDFLLDTKTHSSIVSVADYSPLWAGRSGLVDVSSAAGKERVASVIASLKSSGLIQVGGIQSTTKVTGQQWDAPNAWPPEQDIIIEGLLALNTKESVELATDLMRTWVKAGYVAWQRTGLMFEKYNATELGGIGNGGEYIPQFGFGWTNGVILKYLSKYQHLLHGVDAST
uniref:Trehalase n=1 Tax=Globisporangium ultimum (strain ATCC 200006 / CBS 805.95 / DAOM BR144) TaxID=431595 RepID=K3WZ86_GLOUD